MGFKITHQREGKYRKGWGQGRKGAHGQVCTHDHMVVNVSLLPRGLGERDGPDK